MNRLRRFVLHSGGVSAVEFALAAPILLLMLSGIYTGWTYATQMMQMRSAIKAGSNYILQGGADLTAAKSAVLMTWSNKPKDANVQAIRQCNCGTTVSSCSVVCTGGGAIPQMSVIITASGSIDTPLHSFLGMAKSQTSRQEVIRVR